MNNELINCVRERLLLLDVHEVRKLCRHFDITLRSSNQKKGELIEELVKIAAGGELPQRSNKGAKPKSSGYNEVLAEEIEACRAVSLGKALQVKEQDEDFGVERGAIKKEGFYDGDGVRIGGFSALPTPVNLLTMRYDLRVGDLVELAAEKDGDAFEILKINGESPVKFRKNFADFVRVYPDTRVKLEGDLICRVANIFSPLALGQRAFIVGGQNTGKSAALKSLLTGISGEATKIVLLVGAAPEQVTEFKRSGAGAVYFTTFEMPFEAHLAAVRLVSEHARRLAELGKDVIFAVDGLETLTRTQSPAVTDEIKRLLFTACNDENGGSVTVICTTETGATGGVLRLVDNCLTLSEELAARRVYPAISLKDCYSDRKERFLSERELIAERELGKIAAEKGDEAALEIIKAAKSEDELIDGLLKD